MFLVLDRNTIYNTDNVQTMYVNIDNIKAISIWQDYNAEIIHNRWVINFEFMNGTNMEGPRFPDLGMAEQHMTYIFSNAFEIGRRR